MSAAPASSIDVIPRLYLNSFAANFDSTPAFPCMLNFVFKKSLGDDVRRRLGRIFWAPNPDVSMGYLMLGYGARRLAAHFSMASARSAADQRIRTSRRCCRAARPAGASMIMWRNFVIRTFFRITNQNF